MILGKSYLSVYNSHVVYISSADFSLMPNLQNVIRNIHKDSCFSDISLCQQNPCQSYLIIYFDKEITDINILKDMEEGNAKGKISAFLSVEYFDDIAEIYNVCTERSQRKKGIMKKIFQAMFKEFPSNEYWLGVLLNNPFLNDALSLYLKVNFKPIGIAYTTPHGQTVTTPFISLYVDTITEQYENLYINNNKKYIDSMISFYKKSRDMCSINLNLSKETVDYIYENYIEEDVEYGGAMDLVKERDFYSLQITSVTKGTQNFQIKIPMYYINWHTHPNICYIKNRCFIGWPSGMDMKYILLGYNKGLLLHFLFSKEGIYGINLSTNMATLLKFLRHDHINQISEWVAFHFGSLENFREVKYDKDRLDCLQRTNDLNCYTYVDSFLNKNIEQIINYINTFTLKELMTTYPSGTPSTKIDEIKGYLEKARRDVIRSDINRDILDFNFPIFSSVFRYAKEARASDTNFPFNFIVPPINSHCPLPVKNSPISFFERTSEIL